MADDEQVIEPVSTAVEETAPGMGFLEKVQHWFHVSMFAPQWVQARWRTSQVGYVAALVLQFIAVGCMLLLRQLFPLFTFFGSFSILAMLIVALVWGARASLLSALFGTVLVNYFILAPEFTWKLHNLQQIVETVVFFLVGSVISLLASRTEFAREQTEALVIQLQNEKQALSATQQEAANRARELETILETITDQVLVYDSEGKLLLTNRATQQFNTSTRRLDYYTIPIDQRLSRYSMRNAQDEELSLEQFPVTRILHGEILDSSNAEDIKVLYPDGREALLNVTGSPIRDEQSNLLGAVVICRDVTERRLLEQRTHKALQALLEMAHVMVQSNDEHTVSVSEDSQDDLDTNKLRPASMRTVAGRLAELTRDVLGCRRLSLQMIDPQTGVLRPLAVVGLSAAQEQQWWMEQEANSTPLVDGPVPSVVARLRANEIQCLDMTRPPFDQQPNPFGIRTMLLAPMCINNQLMGLLSLDYSGENHTFTEEERALAAAVAQLVALVIERERLMLERAEAQAREFALFEANARMSDFLGIASHELKTPITTIKGSVQLLESRFKKRQLNYDDKRALADIEGLFKRANTQINRLTRLVNDLVDVSRIQSNKLELQMEPCNLAAIVQDIVHEQQQLNPSRTLRLELETAADLPVYANADRIGQVLTNYLSNALKYSAPEKSVEVSVHREDSSVRVSVTDQGPGLSQNQQVHLWERFYRVEGITVQSGSGVGLGLGLYICRTIIERHGGQVGVDSVQGQGSTFWFTLPLSSRPFSESGGA
ncbi:MAG TPA: ATP-binding protein [Ktedonobacteraceae bacterium]|nr:ATP-binding protein [Ktedonobacteraceae bacterium]